MQEMKDHKGGINYCEQQLMLVYVKLLLREREISPRKNFGPSWRLKERSVHDTL